MFNPPDRRWRASPSAMPLGMDWHDYNEALIERGSSLMDFGFVSTWTEEVESMNEGKEGRPYRFPESYVSFLAFLKVGANLHM